MNSITVMHNRLNSTSKLESIVPLKHNMTEIKTDDRHHDLI